MSARMNLIVLFALVAALGALVCRVEAGALGMPLSVYNAELHDIAPKTMAKFKSIEQCAWQRRNVCLACCRKFGEQTAKFVIDNYDGEESCLCGE